MVCFGLLCFGWVTRRVSEEEPRHKIDTGRIIQSRTCRTGNQENGCCNNASSLAVRGRHHGVPPQDVYVLCVCVCVPCGGWTDTDCHTSSMSSSSSSLPLDPPGSPPLRDNNHTDADHDNNDNDSLLLHHHPQQQPQGSNLRKNGANQLILPPNNGHPNGRQPQLPANNNNLNGKDPSLRAAPASHWNRPIDAAANAPIHQPWSSSPSSSSLWHSYQTFIQTHLTLISIAEDVLTRFVFLVPPPPHTEEHTSSSVSSSVSSGLLSVSSSSRWREVVWGLLQLHRLGVDLALANNNNNDNNANNAKDDHAALLSPSQQGTSVALPMPAKTDQEEEEEEKDASSWLRWLSRSLVPWDERERVRGSRVRDFVSRSRQCAKSSLYLLMMTMIMTLMMVTTIEAKKNHPFPPPPLPGRF